jgi:hypothetical protein
MSKKLTLDYIKKNFGEKGYTVLSDKYINSSSPIRYRCPNGHVYQVSWNKWSAGRRCPYCNPKGRVRKVDLEVIRKEMKKEGYTLLSSEYMKSSDKLKYKCPNGHEYSTSWDAWKSKGNRCAICSKNAKLDIDVVRESIESEGFTLLSDYYDNAHKPLKIECVSGHSFEMSWAHWSSGNRCAICSGKVKHTIEFVRDSFEDAGYTLLTTEYNNGKQKLDYICPNGHKHSISWNNWSQGQRCPVCSNTGFSKGEKEVSDLIKSLGFDVIENSKEIIPPLELDIVIPSKNIAIEYCGLYWHSEIMGKDSKYHNSKVSMCESRGYRLITIFEDEWWTKKDVVISRLKSVLGVNDNTFYARKCDIREISAREARLFCNNHHLQGYGSGSSIKLGAFYNDNLLSVMTFSKLSISKGSKNVDGKWELHRFCSKTGCRIIGIASKMLKYFERNYDSTELISYADRRWSDGNLYKKLGFELSHITKPNYWYFKGTRNRIHRFSLRKQKHDPKNITEWEIRRSEGLNRIWDCGNLKFIKRMEGT